MIRALLVASVLCLSGPVWAQPAALPSVIPIFPLAETTLFPAAARLLLIFEPRYRDMVADALKGDRIIGMVRLRPGFEKDYEGRPPVYEVGAAGEITDFEQLPDGRYTILLRGLVKFRITGEDAGRTYRMARVVPLPERLAANELAALGRLRERLELRILTTLPFRGEPPPSDLADAEYVDTVAQYLNMDEATRQELLEQNGPVPRAQALIELLEAR